jgi:polyisoprenyl-phosphate glycosyltransferase
MKKKFKYSIVVPVYNSEESLEELYIRLEKIFRKLKQSFEIILIDDNSKDNSWKVMNKIYKKNNNVKIIQLMKNFGQDSALMCGFNHAKGDYIITMDDDLQHPPEEILKLINKIKEDYDIVFGVYHKKKHAFFRTFVSNLVMKMFAKVVGIKFAVTSFRIIRKKVITELIKSKNYRININILLSNVTNRIGYVKVKHNKRKHGRTNYTFTMLAKWALNMIFNFTVFPLRLATILGLLFSVFSVLVGVYFLLQYYFNNIIVSGFTSLILSITFFSGIILFIMGIIGEYIGRIFMNLNEKPQYIVRNMK